jgi:D-2-hydroxyacid dehydrogenase (NADP+)
MPTVQVLIAAALPPPLMGEITAINGDAHVVVLSDAQRSLLRQGFSENVDADAMEVKRLLAQTEVLFLSFDAPRSVLREAASARWIHTMAAGVDDLIERGFGRGSYVFTNGSGPHAISIAEYLVMQALMLIKGAPGYFRRQLEGKWERVPMAERGEHTELNGLTVGIVGLGDIGLAAAERFHALGCRVIASRRSARTRESNVGPVDELVPAADLSYLLEQADIVALTLALTPETRHLIDQTMLGRMKKSAFLINISRGGVIDEPALIQALQNRVIAGAALDVFEQEPLPADSPLWGLTNIVITPHVSTTSEHFLPRQVALFKENLRRYLAKEPLLNVVDADRGY